MSAASSLTYNYDKDSFEEGTFEDISELSLEDEDGEEETDLDDNYEMEIERTRIIMPKYSAKNRKSLRTLIEEQKDDEELLESNTERGDEQNGNEKIEIEEISRTSDEDQDRQLDDSDTDYNEDGHNLLNKNSNENVINDGIKDEENSSDSDDVEMKLNEDSHSNDGEIDIVKKSPNNTDTEDNIDKEDEEINVVKQHSAEKITDDLSAESLLDDEENTENEDSITNETNIELVISTKRPSSFNSDEHSYHLDFIKKSQTSLKSNSQTRSKTSVNKNLSFSNERLRDIERQNKILLQRIIAQKPTYENLRIKNSNKNIQARRMTSAAINRKKQQQQIDLDNQLLKRKLESIALRRRAKP